MQFNRHAAETGIILLTRPLAFVRFAVVGLAKLVLWGGNAHLRTVVPPLLAPHGVLLEVSELDESP